MEGKDQLVRLSESECEFCKEKYYHRKFQNAASKYCSRRCRGFAHRGSGNGHWTGGRSMHADGYIRTYSDDNMTSPDSRGRILEHRLVMEKHLGRPLTKDETVHHKNGNRQDNRLENLEIWSSRHPKGQRVSDLVEYAKEILAKYGHL